MPTYSFRDMNTNEVWDQFFSNNSEKEAFLQENPHIKQTITKAPANVDDTRLGSGLKHSKEMRQVFQKINKAHPRTTVDRGNITET